MTAAGPDLHAITRRPQAGPRPLSFPQERMFLLHEIMAGSSAYSVPTLYRIATTLDEATLRAAFERVVTRHEIARTRIRLLDGAPVQEVAPPAPFELEVSDLRGLPAQERRPRADELLGELVRRPFDLAADQLIRAALVHVEPDEDLLLVVFHHIASDHASGTLLWGELEAAYRALLEGGEPQLPELPVQYGDFAVWQREHLSGALLDELLEYWTEQLRGAPERLELPTDRPRPSAQSYRGAWAQATVPAAASAPLRELARAHGTSLYMVLLAGFKALVHRYTGAEDIVVGAPVSGRHHEEIAPLLGFFSNTLALRTDLAGDPTFVELLGRVRETLLGGLAYQELPFEKLVEVLNPSRARSHSPIFQVLFGYDRVAARERMFAGASAETLPVPGWESARFDLSIIVHDLPGGELTLNAGYATDLFDSETIMRLLGHLQTLWAGAAADATRPVSRLELLSEPERRRMLVEWNATARDYDRRCLHELFAEQARRRPDAVAVQSQTGRITYEELERRANQLAAHLMAAGVQPGALVGICLERSVELVVAMVAVLKTGAAYVPVEPTYPPERQAFMLADAGARVLVCDARHAAGLPRGELAIVDLDAQRGAIDGQHGDAPPALTADPEALAYVIYTSGSTGRPKGVEIRHRSVANLVAYMRERPGLTEHDVVANLTTPAFDLSVPDWWLPLTTGARLVIVPREATLDGVQLADWLARTGASFVQATPTTWQLLIDAGWSGSAELKIVCGGEALPRALAGELRERGASLWHMYGPTETTVWSSVLELGELAGPPPLGGPIANTSFYVIDRHGEPVPVGVSGELLIGGEGVARGYHGRPELSAEKFVADPFDAGSSAGRVYRTGDLVRWRPGGTLEFLGRIDQQVKLRGFRIELGEIEAVLSTHPDVAGAVAAVREDEPGDQRLIAYLVAEGGRAPLEIEALRRLAKAKLPPFMVPSAFVELEAFPVTANGKLDRRALPAPDGSRRELASRYVAPETPVQEALAGIMAEVLGVARVGLDDDFFDLGGHSLLAVRLVARLQERFALTVYLATVFEHPTVRGLSAVVTDALLVQEEDDELASLLSEIENLES